MDFEIKITKDFLKKSYFRRLFRSWWKLAIAFCLIFFGVILELRSEGLGTISTIGLTLICICILVYSFAWYKHLKYINEFIAKQGDVPIKYKLTKETVETESVLGGSKLRWDAFKRLRINNLATLLELPDSGALTLPTNQLNKEILEYLQDRFTTHRKKILIDIKRAEHLAVADR